MDSERFANFSAQLIDRKGSRSMTFKDFRRPSLHLGRLAKEFSQFFRIFVPNRPRISITQIEDIARWPHGLEGTMEFPKIDFRDEEACFKTLLEWVHPDGTRCPFCGEREGIHVHENHRKGWRVRYRC